MVCTFKDSSFKSQEHASSPAFSSHFVPKRKLKPIITQTTHTAEQQSRAGSGMGSNLRVMSPLNTQLNSSVQYNKRNGINGMTNGLRIDYSRARQSISRQTAFRRITQILCYSSSSGCHPVFKSSQSKNCLDQQVLLSMQQMSTK